MKHRVHIAEHLQNLSTFGNGIVPGVPLIEIVADGRVLIEHHQGVCKYTNDQICVKTSLGIIRVDGHGLQLKIMTKEQLTIIGTIIGITIIRSREHAD